MARKSATADAGNGDKVAKLLNISIPQVYNLANSGIIPKSDNGVWDTIIACENLKRKCRAIEISPAYVAVALERWHVHTGRQPELLP